MSKRSLLAHPFPTLVLGSLIAFLDCGGKSPITGGSAGSTGHAEADAGSPRSGGESGAAGNNGGVGSSGSAGNAGSSGTAGSLAVGGAGGAGETVCLGSAAGAGGQVADPAHRPTAIICPVTVGGGVPAQDGGIVSCTTSADCAPDGAVTFFRNCVNHQCGADECFTDADCTTGHMCGCASSFGGNIIHTNSCVPSGCRVDTDCASGLCSPDRGGGYHCHSSADTCHADSDCASCDGGSGYGYACLYATEVGHWQCTQLFPISG
jgi:hypothetical protein